MVSDIDEDAVVAGLDALADAPVSAEHVATVLAAAKAQRVADQLGSEALVVGCDSVFVFDGDTLGKPGTPQQARDRWLRMRGHSGVLLTGHCVIDAATGQTESGVAHTTVWFAEVTDAEVDWYVGTGEPLEVAGAFTMDGRAAPFITRIDGDPSNVIGLSLPLLRELLANIGIPWTSITEH